MDIWNILGIQPTDQKKVIKAAYRNKLREVNPEDDPESFMTLREAYEKALKGEKRSGDVSGQQGGNPIKAWGERLEHLYRDNTRRFDVKNWEAILEEDVCVSLDTRDEAGLLFMEFFSNHPNLSRQAAQKAEAVFHFTEKQEKLFAHFPQNMVEYFLYYCLVQEEYPQHEFFAREPLVDADYDEYINTFHRLCDALSEEKEEEAERLLKCLDETGIRHPSTETKRAQHCRQNIEGAEDILRRIDDTWGEFDEAVFMQGIISMDKGEAEAAEQQFRRVLELNDGYPNGRLYLVFALKAQERYLEARDEAAQVLDENPMMNLSGLLEELEEGIILQCEQELTKDLISEDHLHKLAMSYYNRGREEDAERILDMLADKPEWEIRARELQTVILINRGEWGKALISASSWLKKAEEDADIWSLAQCHRALGTIKMNQGMLKEGLADIDKGVELADGTTDHLMHKAYLLFRFECYQLAADAYSRILEKDPRNANCRYLRGICHFEAGYLQEAIDDFDSVAGADPGALPIQIYRTRVFLEAGMEAPVKELFHYFEDNGFDTDSVKLLHAIYHGYKEEKEEQKQARQILERIVANYDPAQSDLEDVGEVYLYLAQIAVRQNKSRKAAEVIEQGLALQPDYIPLHIRKYELYEQQGESEKGEATLQRILQINPYNRFANHKLAKIHEGRGEMEKAAVSFDMLLQIGESLSLYIDKAYNHIMREDYDTARRLIAKIESLNPEDGAGLRLKGYYHMVMGENDKAIPCYRRAEEEELLCREEIADCHIHSGDFDSARMEYRWLIDNGYAERGHEKMFDLELRLGDYFAAEKQLDLWRKAGYRLALKDDDYKVMMGRLLIEKGQWDAAFDNLDAASVNVPYARILAASILLYQGKAKKALKKFQSCIEEWPNLFDPYFLAGVACLVLDNRTGAEAFARQGLERMEALQNHGNSLKDKYKNYGSLYTLLGEYAQAERFFQQCDAVPLCAFCEGHDCHEVHTRRGILYHLAGEEEKSRKDFERACAIKPGDIDLVGTLHLIRKGKL